MSGVVEALVGAVLIDSDNDYKLAVRLDWGR